MVNATYVDILKQHDLSNTKSRAQVFSALAEAEIPLSMNELIGKCQNVDRVSIYRIIAVFERLEIVHRVQLGWKYKLELGDSFHAHHHHMTCLTCSRIIKFDEPLFLDKELKLIAANKNFILQQHTLELRGICDDCKSSQAT